jgi:hypothetical protein
MGLESEYQHHSKGDRCALEENLRTNGATESEIAFMFQDFDRLRSTRRVELNAMTSPQFIDFVERKLRDNGIAKIIPDQALLAKVYASLEKGRRLKEAANDIQKKINTSDGSEAPADLEQRVTTILEKYPAMRWDDALTTIVGDEEANSSAVESAPGVATS